MEKIKDLYYQNQYHRFDFYATPLNFISKNWDEKFLKLADYGITHEDISEYVSIIENERQRINYIKNKYSKRIFIASIAYGFFLFFFFWWSIGYFNDFMKSINLFYDIILYICYIAYIYFLVKIAYPWGAYVIQSFGDTLLDSIKYPSYYTVKIYSESTIIRLPYLVNEHINKYFDDLLWILHLKQLNHEEIQYYEKKPKDWDQTILKELYAYFEDLNKFAKSIKE